MTRDEASRRNFVVVVAIAGEIAYVLGRSLIRPAFEGAAAGELAVTAWRIVFVVLDFWLLRAFLRDPLPTHRVPRHPLLVVAATLLCLAPFAGFGMQTDWGTRGVFAITIPVIAVREELFYRAILLVAMERWLGARAAVLLVSIVFVLFHIGAQPMNVFTVASMFSAGLLLTVVYQRTRNLLAVVVQHGVIDLALMIPPARLIPLELMLLGDVTAGILVFAWWVSDRKREAQRP